MKGTGRNLSIASNFVQQDETEHKQSAWTFLKQSSINYIDSKCSLDLEDEFQSMNTMPSPSEGQNLSLEGLEHVLINVPRDSSGDDPSLIVRKDRGGLIYPGKDIVKICEITEKKIIEASHTNDLFTKKNILQLLCVKVASVLPTQFPDRKKKIMT